MTAVIMWVRVSIYLGGDNLGRSYGGIYRRKRTISGARHNDAWRFGYLEDSLYELSL